MKSSDGLITFGRKLKPAGVVSTAPDWMQSKVSWIDRALQRALELPSGGWYAVGASRDVADRPRRYRVDAEDYVAWRADGLIRVGPDRCPHMGASLAEGFVRDGCVVCPWHGLALSSAQQGGWHLVDSYDDGVLLWIRPGLEQAGVTRPVLAPRPQRFLDAVMSKEVACEPQDVIANRLDPWHGVHFHGHAFAQLKIIEQTEADITARVIYRVLGQLGVEVDAHFHCPEPRTIVMTIVDGEGRGSVVETHATPIEHGRCTIIEATLATSDRPLFHHVVRLFGTFLRPLVVKRADRLWAEDAAYAERRYAIRRRDQTPHQRPDGDRVAAGPDPASAVVLRYRR